MYQLIIANKNYSSWSLRVWLLMQQIKIPFSERLITFEQGNSREKFSRISPTGLLPCLIDEDTLIWDSLAIVEYLAEAFPEIWPTNKLVRAWARSATCEMHSSLQFFNSKSLSCATQVELKHLPEKSREDIIRVDRLWQEGLKSLAAPSWQAKILLL
ncbi:glutathione S-transferase N-terminal domain-containing protein [Microbulbifer sp. MLAF003]|uniref:glutathione S-transferase n=1 Tax=Microbulbifer sp. MLAF003 TaxID=3032582 RepID=UPI00333FAF21